MKVPTAYKEAARVANVWRWYKDVEAALSNLKQNILIRIKERKPLPPEYESKSKEKLNNQFDKNFKELKYATMLSLISAIEAAFRIDYQTRLDRGEDFNNKISQTFLRLSRQKMKGEWTKFGDDILETWKNVAPSDKCKEAVIALKEMLRLRDWLAHGRCWERRYTQKYNPETIIIVAERLMESLPHNNFFGRKYLSTT
jgi:hypothetical protein